MKRQNREIVVMENLPLEMVYVEGGDFQKGGDVYGEKLVGSVRLNSFFIGRFPVTQELYELVMGENPSRFKGENRPVEKVSWDDAVQFAKKLTELAGREFRLPTEAEWEFAALGGLQGNNFTYSGSNRLEEVGWFNENSYGETKPVGLKLANELGLYDMSGNVWEWCKDWFGENYYEECSQNGVVTDPQGPESGSIRVLRGGSFFNHPGSCRSALRDFLRPEGRGGNIGFRLVAPCQSVG